MQADKVGVMERLIKYVPSPCASEDAKFEGHVMIAAPKYTERMKWLEEAGFKTGPKGEIEYTVEQLPAVMRMAEIAKTRVRHVEIKAKESGQKYTMWEDLEYDPDCDAIILDVALKMLNGFKPSPN